MSCKSQDGKFKQQRKLDTTCFNDSYKQSYIIILAMSYFVTLQKGGEKFYPTGQAMHSLSPVTCLCLFCSGKILQMCKRVCLFMFP